MSARPLIVYSRFETGHRAAYLTFIAGIYETRRAARPRDLFSRAPLLFLMIEENFLLFVTVAVFRQLMGRRTGGLLFRPREALRGRTPRLWLKRQLLRLIRALPRVGCFILLDVNEPGASSLWRGVVYDFQLWDLPKDVVRDDRPKTAAGRDVAEALIPSDRPVITAIGRQDRSKGFAEFAAACAALSKRGAAHFVAAGSVAAECRDDRTRMLDAGGTLIDRYVSDNELEDFYRLSDIVWCCYSAEYDQASGVLGRAVQFGRPVVVRPESLIQTFCQTRGIPHLTPGMLAEPGVLRSVSRFDSTHLVAQMRDASIRNLNAALDIREKSSGVSP